MKIEGARVRQHLAERGIEGATIRLMSAADRNMREALKGVDPQQWALSFPWEFSQVAAQLVQVRELEQHARQQRADLVGHVTRCLGNVPGRRARRRARRLLRRLERDAGVVAGGAVR